MYESISKNHPKTEFGDFNPKIGKEEIYRPTIGKNHTLSNDNDHCIGHSIVLNKNKYTVHFNEMR